MGRVWCPELRPAVPVQTPRMETRIDVWPENAGLSSAVRLAGHIAAAAAFI